MTYKPRQKKSIWFRAKFGDKPPTKPRKRIRPVSDSMARLRRKEAALKKKFLARPENEFCPVALTILGKKVRTVDHHHKFGKGFPALRLAVEHWLAVSRWGHDWIERNKDEARKYGWLCQRGEWNTLP